MAHTSQTEYYGLPQYEGSDKPSWLDFNEPFEDVDTALHQAVTSASTTAEAVATVAANLATTNENVASLATRVGDAEVDIRGLKAGATEAATDIAGLKASDLGIHAEIDAITPKINRLGHVIGGSAGTVVTLSTADQVVSQASIDIAGAYNLSAPILVTGAASNVTVTVTAKANGSLLFSMAETVIAGTIHIIPFFLANLNLTADSTLTVEVKGDSATGSAAANYSALTCFG